MPKIKASDFLDADDDFIDIIAEKISQKTKSNESNVLKQYCVKDVMKITKLGKQTIHNHIKKGLLQASKPGKSYIISHESLMEYLNPKKK